MQRSSKCTGAGEGSPRDLQALPAHVRHVVGLIIRRAEPQARHRALQPRLRGPALGVAASTRPPSRAEAGGAGHARRRGGAGAQGLLRHGHGHGRDAPGHPSHTHRPADAHTRTHTRCMAGQAGGARAGGGGGEGRGRGGGGRTPGPGGAGGSALPALFGGSGRWQP